MNKKNEILEIQKNMYSDSKLLLNNTYLRANLKFNKDKLGWFLMNYMQSVGTEKYAVWKKISILKLKKPLRPWCLYSN